MRAGQNKKISLNKITNPVKILQFPDFTALFLKRYDLNRISSTTQINDFLDDARVDSNLLSSLSLHSALELNGIVQYGVGDYDLFLN